MANPSKTNLLFINLKQPTNDLEDITVGKTKVTQVKHAKLLGMTLDDDLGWKTHIEGKGGLIPSLNSRLYLIKRLKNHLNADRLKKVADGIWTSKLRYGLQLYGKVRTSDTDPTNSTIKKLQTAQNKLARVLENVYLRDRMCTKKLLSNQVYLGKCDEIKDNNTLKMSIFCIFPPNILKV